MWPANALLVAQLVSTPRRQWLQPTLGVMAVCGLVTGVYGLGWNAAAFTMCANACESLLAATLLTLMRPSVPGLTLLPWSQWQKLVVGLIAPIAGAAASVLFVPGDAPHAFLQWYLSHALGLMVFLPGMIALMQSRQVRMTSGTLPYRLACDWGLPLVMGAVSWFCFVLSPIPLFYVPVLALVAGMVIAEPLALALMYLTLAMVAAWTVGHGRSYGVLLHLDHAHRLSFAQLYLMAVALGVMPVAGAVRNMRQLLIRLRESEARYRLLADNSTDIIMSTSPEGRIRFASHSVRQLVDHDPDTLMGTFASDLVAHSHRRKAIAAHRRAIEAQGEMVVFEFMGQLDTGQPRWFEAHMRCVQGRDGEAECVVSVIRDMSERKKHESELTLAALTDPLTGLPNRRMFIEAVSDCVEKGRTACIALIDLDHFKLVNDRFGHAAGDEVLKTFATVARQGLRASDMLARIGGEEFALLLPGASMSVAKMICGRLGATLGQAVTHHGDVEISVTSSIGLARLGSDPEETMSMADKALYEAKAAGRDRLSVAA
ncbi:MAG TPA: diguanylate cyclase [Novosphingobium sp.]|nr:diguanylate cyclase [Novosphingobium sp.]